MRSSAMLCATYNDDVVRVREGGMPARASERSLTASTQQLYCRKGPFWLFSRPFSPITDPNPKMIFFFFSFFFPTRLVELNARSDILQNNNNNNNNSRRFGERPKTRRKKKERRAFQPCAALEKCVTDSTSLQRRREGAAAALLHSTLTSAGRKPKQAYVFTHKNVLRSIVHLLLLLSPRSRHRYGHL